MTGKTLFTPCSQHSDCTQRSDFVEAGTQGFDPSVDARPISELVRTRAQEAFGEVYCVSISHLPGKLAVSRVG